MNQNNNAKKYKQHEIHCIDSLFSIGKCNIEGIKNFTGAKQHKECGNNQKERR